MQKFSDYTDITRNIHASDELKARVLHSARAGKVVPIGKQASRRSFGFAQKAAIAAVLAFCIPITACATIAYTGLAQFLTFRGMDAQVVESMVETFPTEATADTAATGELIAPEFSAQEALCDQNALYLAVKVTPRDERYLLIPADVGTNDNVSNLYIPGVSGMTIEEYAVSLGKEILWVSCWPELDTQAAGMGRLGTCDADGNVNFYFEGGNPIGKQEFELSFECQYFTGDNRINERSVISATIHDKSTAAEAARFTQFAENEAGVTIHDLTIEETELGIYATFTFTPPDGNSYYFYLMDANEEYLPALPGGALSPSARSDDGTCSIRNAYQKPGSLEGIQYQIVKFTDTEKYMFGPYKILG